ncbi:phosphonate C-P lyase system protein PhnH [Paenibacillus eucommiae]|uniref:Alpha-D-ribose 1-methylphosphonate 5-triphosphate synthase subunit PhnH n=1 Tax=Paenibacillus eucommiae TaxID=1355755 RepID=A0ABS4IX54_9BACL|nr:phosphonate C-P lyase system protein PhnH [Paenibacillus eucommiae]MBP1992163.1 alpha-D-ribose 1-methylphosphonate 5-triphosphate synthase subunit PhnH [Paenibacillus eucommiae]
MSNPNPNPNLKEPSFDRIHDTQEIYRVLLHAMSRPGLICELGVSMDGVDLPVGTSKAAAAIAFTLLDGEVTFAVQMYGQEGWTETIRRLTYCKLVDFADADYVFVEGNEELRFINQLQSQLRKGTLSSPEKSATVFIRVKHFVNNELLSGHQGCSLKLTGPGIQTETMCYVTGLSFAWIESRARLVEEYPLGVDLILYTENGELIAIPRTTVVEGVAGAWHM